MKVISHQKGKHRSTPFILKRMKEIDVQVGFVETEYELHTNKGQWNKLFGIKKRFFSPKKDSVMIAWRHENNKLELAPYIHKNGETIILESVELNSKVDLHYLEINQKGIQINNKWYHYPLWFKKGWYINSWFGGKLSAPKNLYFVFHF